MLDIKLHELGSVADEEIKIVICVSKIADKWVLCKHKNRDTWECPGGHVEASESLLDAARRELFEETGTTQADIKPICLYSISNYGLICFADIKQMQTLPNFEMQTLGLFDEIPENLTYPEAHLLFMKVVNDYLHTRDINT